MLEAYRAAEPDTTATLGAGAKLFRVVGRGVGRDGRGEWSLVACAGSDSVSFLESATDCRATRACGIAGCASLADRRPMVDSDAAVQIAFVSDDVTVKYDLSLVDSAAAPSKLAWSIVRSGTLESRSVDATSGALLP